MVLVALWTSGVYLIYLVKGGGDVIRWLWPLQQDVLPTSPFQNCFRGAEGGRCSDNGGNQDTPEIPGAPVPHRVRATATPLLNHKRINKLLCGHEWLHRTRATTVGLVIPGLFLFLLLVFFFSF